MKLVSKVLATVVMWLLGDAQGKNLLNLVFDKFNNSLMKTVDQICMNKNDRTSFIILI